MTEQHTEPPRPPKFVRDGKTGEFIPVNQDAPYDGVTAWMLMLVDVVGFDLARQILSIPKENQ